MKKSKLIKLDIIMNFVDYFTSNEKERDSMKKIAVNYTAEDHVDEIEQGIPKYRTVVLVISVDKMSDGRKAMESVENEKFRSIDAIQQSICFDENDPIAVEDLAILEMTEFMDLCNNTDDDTIKEERVDVANVWIGYVQLRKSNF